MVGAAGGGRGRAGTTAGTGPRIGPVPAFCAIRRAALKAGRRRVRRAY